MDVGLEPRYPHLADPFTGKTTTSIRVEDVCFRYGDGPRVLDDVNRHIRAGRQRAGNQFHAIQHIGLPSLAVIPGDACILDLHALHAKRQRGSAGLPDLRIGRRLLGLPGG